MGRFYNRVSGYSRKNPCECDDSDDDDVQEIDLCDDVDAEKIHIGW
jgi:hypothetical protein